MRPRGIPIAQIDSGLEADPKFVALHVAHPAEYHQALGTYMSLALRAWATASREADPYLCLGCPADSLRLLREYGLLDDENRIPEAVFDRYIGEVLRGREAEAERKRTVRRTSGGHLAESVESSSPLLYSPTDYGTENSTAVPGREGWVELGPLVTELTGTAYPSPDSKLARMLLEDVRDFGMPRVRSAAAAVAEAMDGKADLRALAFGVRNALRPPPDGRKVAAAEREDEERRDFERRLEATKRRIAAMKGGVE